MVPISTGWLRSGSTARQRPALVRGGFARQAGLAALGAALVCACGPSEAEVRRAKSSAYKAEFPIVYSEALAATRDLYPQLVEDARTGVIKTAWHSIRVRVGQEAGGSDPTSGDPTVSNYQSSGGGLGSPSGDGTPVGIGGDGIYQKRYFVRFQIRVVGGQPWRVHVTGEASSWRAGEVPTPLRGAEVPHWLPGRVDALRLAIHKRLEKYAVQLVTTVGDPPAGPIEEEPVVKDYGSIPSAAARVVAKIEQAATGRKFGRLRELMVDDFVWSFGDSPSADVAVAMWRADPAPLTAIAEAIGGGCRLDPEGGTVACPVASVEEAGYIGFRIGLAKRDGHWLMSFAVSGD